MVARNVVEVTADAEVAAGAEWTTTATGALLPPRACLQDVPAGCDAGAMGVVAAPGGASTSTTTPDRTVHPMAVRATTPDLMPVLAPMGPTR